MYEFAGDGQFGLTFCVPLESDQEFYGALCSDYNISQMPIKFQGSNDMMYQGIYQEAKVLQREAFNFEFQLERIAQLVGEEVDENQTFEI